MQAAIKAVHASKLAYAGRAGGAMSQTWTGGQNLYFKKYAMEHLVTLAGACNYEIDVSTKQAMRVLSVATVVRCTARTKQIRS
jgi:hypothetical protein